jgi:uncharacterized membrane protein YvlD (DUF360 family)
MDQLNNIDFKYWLLQTLAMMLTCFLLPKLRVSGPIPALLTVVTLSFVNSHLWSSALFLKIPDEMAYKAIMLVLTNGALFFVVVKILPGIEISGILPAILAPLIFSGLSIFIDQYKEQIDLGQIYTYLMEYFKLAKSYFIQEKQSLSLEPIILLS